MLKNKEIFLNNFSQDLVKSLNPIIRQLKCTPEEIIIIKGDLDDCSIFFIEEGIVELYSEKIVNDELASNRIQTLSSSQTFGQLEFFTGFNRYINV